MNVGFSTNYSNQNQANLNFKAVKYETGRSVISEYKEFAREKILPFIGEDTIKALNEYGDILIGKNNNAKNLVNVWFETGTNKFKTYPVRKTIRIDEPLENVQRKAKEFASEAKQLFLG